MRGGRRKEGDDERRERKDDDGKRREERGGKKRRDMMRGGKKRREVMRGGNGGREGGKVMTLAMPVHKPLWRTEAPPRHSPPHHTRLNASRVPEGQCSTPLPPLSLIPYPFPPPLPLPSSPSLTPSPPPPLSLSPHPDYPLPLPLPKHSPSSVHLRGSACLGRGREAREVRGGRAEGSRGREGGREM